MGENFKDFQGRVATLQEAEDCSLQGVWEEYDRHNMQCRH